MLKILISVILMNIMLFASIGKIRGVKGEVNVLRDGKTIVASKGTKLENKDIVKSIGRSRAQIVFKDKTTITIGKNAVFKIEDYLYDPKKPKKSKTSFKFMKGAFKSITGVIGKVAPHRFKLKTKTATIGIRGTILIGDQTKVACTQGEISVSSHGITQIVPAGMITITPENAPPSAPVEFKAADIASMDSGSDTLEEEELLEEVDSSSKDANKQVDKASSQTTESSKNDVLESDLEIATYEATLKDAAQKEAEAAAAATAAQDAADKLAAQEVADAAATAEAEAAAVVASKTATLTGKQLGSLTNSAGTTNKNNFTTFGDVTMNKTPDNLTMSGTSTTQAFNAHSNTGITAPTHVGTNKQNSFVTSLSDGGYLVTWDSDAQDGDGYGVYGQRFTSDGVAAGSEFAVNTSVSNSQSKSSSVALSDGSFIVSWDSGDGSTSNTFSQLFNVDGTKNGTEVQVNTTIGNEKDNSKIVALDGKYMVVYRSTWHDGTTDKIVGQMYNNDGSVIGGEVTLSNTASDWTKEPSVTSLANGDVVVSWDHGAQDPKEVFFSIVKNDGTVVESAVQANSFTTGTQSGSSVVGLGNGKFIISWTSESQDNAATNDGVYAQVFNADGTKSGGEFKLSTYTGGDATDSKLTKYGDNKFIATWSSSGQDAKVYAQIYDNDGNKVGVEFAASAGSTATGSTSSITVLDDGRFVVSWKSDNGNIYSQVFEEKADGSVAKSGSLTYAGFDGGGVGTYKGTNSNVGSMAFTRTIDGVEHTGTYQIQADNTGEFMVGTTDEQWTIDGETHNYKDMYYSGKATDTTKLEDNKEYVYSGFKELVNTKDGGTFLNDSSYNSDFTNKTTHLNTKTKSMTQYDRTKVHEAGATFNSMRLKSDGTVSGVKYSKDTTTNSVGSVDGSLYGSDGQGFGATSSSKTHTNSGATNQDLKSSSEGIQASYLGSTKDVVNTGTYTQNRGFQSGGAPANTGVLNIDRESGTISGTTVMKKGATAYTASGTVNDGSSYYINDDKYGVLIQGNGAVDKASWMVAVPDKMDANGELTQSADDESSWGYWTADLDNGDGTITKVDHRSTWVSGTATDTSHVQNLIDSGASASFSGNTMGTVSDGTNTGSILMNGNNQLDIGIDFGGGVNAVTGNMAFDSQIGSETVKNWSSTIGGGTVTNSGFNADLGGGAGSMQGAYYGTGEVKSVGGNFNLGNGGQTAQGVFKATKQ
ncbi:MAG: hypothetical protein GQ570_14860 [Helicobacteraceae bacterium]|nr:hypothetical protein [Helicobacteraceae bacterium]